MKVCTHFGLGLLVGIILTVIIVWVFKHKLAKYYAGRYGTHFAEAVETGVEEFIKEFLPGTDIQVGLKPRPGNGVYYPFPLN